VATPAPAPPVAQPPATSTGAAPTLPPIGIPVQPTATPAPSTPTKVPPKTHHADGGVGTEDAAAPTTAPIPGIPGMPFPIPSTLPSFPIPIPSTFPPFSLPGFPGAPAPTSSH
jgi:hypothetical protein